LLFIGGCTLILTYGDVSKVQGQPWFLCEIRSEKTAESTLRRMGKALGGIFRDAPIEIFIPVVKRDLDIFELSTGPYLFVRSTNFSALLRLKSVTGICGLVTEGDTNRPSKAIPVEDAYVQSLIKQAADEHQRRAIGIEVGSFVRILNGETRDFCGTVEIIGDGRAVVRVTLRTKSILLETPVRNLLNLSHVPKEQRVYYYCQLVADLFRDFPAAAAAMVEEDLHLDESAPPVEQVAEVPTDEPKKHSRQRTVTALVKKLVLIEGQHNPMEIAKAVVASLKRKEIKAPKNLFIVYCLPGETVMQGLLPFRASDGLISNDVLDLNGDIQALTDYMARPYKGKLVEVSLLGNLPFRSTPEHGLLVLRSKKNSKGQTWRPHWGTSPKSVKNPAPVWVPASEVRDSDFLLCPVKLPKVGSVPIFQESSHHLAKKIITGIKPNKELAWLFGLYIADGGKTGETSFSLTLDKKTSVVKVQAALAQFGVTADVDEHENYRVVRVNSVSLAATFREWFGEDRYTKHIPEFLYGWDEECLRGLIDGYAEGDGHDAEHGNGGHWATTASYQLAYQIWYLLVALKCYPSISHYHDGEQTNFGSRAKSWMIWWTDTGKEMRHDTFYHAGYYCMPVKSVALVEFDGNVHNFSVANTETYVANGVVAHNCIVKDRLRQDYFAKIDPSLSNYREIIKKYGKEYKFSAAQIAKIDPALGIPVLTQEVCKDGRSREARQKSRAKTLPAAEVKRLAAAKKEPKKRKKLPTDKCGECLHERKAHKLSPKGAWMRCTDVSNHAIHPWVSTKQATGPCWCVRFKEKKK
jgi:hypothetical protein